MIYKLKSVIPKKIFRGSAPSPMDVLWLKNNLKINKIVSLDQNSANKIIRPCKMLGIKQIIIPIDGTKKSILNFLSYNLKELLLNDGPTYVHCQAGKDRTGFVIALFKCKYMNVKPEDALKEAKSLGFGINVDPKFIELLEKLIMKCKPEIDINSADIVSNEREYISDNRSSFLDEAHQGSFAPYLSHTKQNPMDAVYNYINDQSPIRENYHPLKDKIEEISSFKENDMIPQVGIFNNDAGLHGAGPAEPVGGFIY